jgi:hypothetical protein
MRSREAFHKQNSVRESIRAYKNIQQQKEAERIASQSSVHLNSSQEAAPWEGASRSSSPCEGASHNSNSLGDDQPSDQSHRTCPAPGMDVKLTSSDDGIKGNTAEARRPKLGSGAEVCRLRHDFHYIARALYSLRSSPVSLLQDCVRGDGPASDPTQPAEHDDCADSASVQQLSNVNNTQFHVNPVADVQDLITELELAAESHMVLAKEIVQSHVLRDASAQSEDAALLVAAQVPADPAQRSNIGEAPKMCYNLHAECTNSEFIRHVCRQQRPSSFREVLPRRVWTTVCTTCLGACCHLHPLQPWTVMRPHEAVHPLIVLLRALEAVALATMGLPEWAWRSG